jgi:hypothetical protein
MDVYVPVCACATAETAQTVLGASDDLTISASREHSSGFFSLDDWIHFIVLHFTSLHSSHTGVDIPTRHGMHEDGVWKEDAAEDEKRMLKLGNVRLQIRR